MATDVGGGASTAADSLETAVPHAVSHVQSAAHAAATHIPAVVAASLPRNCSIGTSRFCVGSARDVSCYDLPPNVEALVPPELRHRLGVGAGGLRALDAALSDITTTTVRDVWAVGLVLLFLLLASCLASVSGLALFGRSGVRAAVHVVAGLVSCVPFAMVVAVLHLVRSRLAGLPSWIHVAQGGLLGLAAGSLCCAVVSVAFCGGLLAVC